MADGVHALVANPYINSGSLPYRFRQRRFRHIKSLIEAIIERKGSCRILDIGGEENYWDIAGNFLNQNKIEIHLLNIKLQPVTRPCFISMAGDAAQLDHLADNSYDLVHSNSVIEHVGNWHRMRAMASHVRRLAPSYFVQTPNFWFPFEPHFRCPIFHWLPEQVRYRLLLTFNLGFGGRQHSVDAAMESVQSACLLDARQFATLFDDADIVRERVLLMTKSLMVIRSAR